MWGIMENDNFALHIGKGEGKYEGKYRWEYLYKS
jgi:hypothetical protein